jgi:hypothetical protein
MLSLTPNTVTSFPGARLIFSVSEGGSDLSLSSSPGSRVEIFFPGEHPHLATIHESNDTFSWVVPLAEGTHTVRALVSFQDIVEYATFTVTINPILASKFVYRSAPELTATGTVYADIYNPVGQLVHSAPMTDTGYGYEISTTPGSTWFDDLGPSNNIPLEFTILIRDDNGVIEADSMSLERPSFASMKSYFSLPDWHRQIIEYLKYEMMGDTEPLHPGALFTLEEYSKHWMMTVGEINDTMPTTTYHPAGIPTFWANVMMKGTLLRIYHALANRAITIPRWQNLDAPIQDESHYQQAYEQRYSLLRPEYEYERATMKGAHLPSPAVTVDPFLGWVGGNLAGQTGLAMIGRPSWFAGVSGLGR